MSTLFDVINVLFFSGAIIFMMMIRSSSAHKCNEVYDPYDETKVVGI